MKPDTHAGGPERWWLGVLAPTLNNVLPFGRTDRLRWEAFLHQKQPTAENRTLTAWIHDIVNGQGQRYSAEHALALATEAVGHVGRKPFECFFHCVQNLAKAAWGIPLSRRLLIRIPCYDDQVINQVQYTSKGSVLSTNLLLVASTWYAQALPVLPEYAHTASVATRPMAHPSTPLRVARLLSTKQVALQAHQHVVNLAEKSVSKFNDVAGPACLETIGSSNVGQPPPLFCAYLQQQHVLLHNNRGHQVLRHPWQCGLVLSKLPAPLMGSNARSKVLHCPTPLEPAMQRLQHSLQKKSTPQCAYCPYDGTSHDTALLQPEQAIDTVQEFVERVKDEAYRRAWQAPHLQPEVAQQAELDLRCLQIATGQIDKKVTRLRGVHSTLHKARILRDNLLGDEFLVRGWVASPAMAKAVAVFQIFENAKS